MPYAVPPLLLPAPPSPMLRSHHYAKPTTWIITPRVVSLVREHFGCPTMKGMALEDIPMSGGAGSHWEARLMGPEVRAQAACACWRD